MDLQTLALDKLHPSPHNPRQDFPKESLQQLANSIALRGVEQPLKARPNKNGFELVFGHRRLKAAQLAGLKEVPVLVQAMTDVEVAEAQLAENIDREDLAPLEVAGGYRRLLELGQTMDQVCERSGRRRTQVYATLKLLDLGPEAKKSLGEGKISPSVAQLVARVPKALQSKALAVVEGTMHMPPLSYREAEKQLGTNFTVDLKKAPFDTKDAKLCPAAGACTTCPKRAGNAKDLYPELDVDRCTDRPCFDEKVHADAKRTVEAKGYKLLSLKDAPPSDLFWNDGTGPLRDEAPYVSPDSTCYDDTQQRKYRDLLTPEQLKKAVVVALDGNGKPTQLLAKAGLMRDVKKGGLFREKKAREAKATPSTKTSAKPAEYKPPPPSIDELTDKAVLAACVAAAEKKGLTPAIVKMCLLDLLSLTESVYERRGMKELGYGRLDEKQFDKAFGKLSPGKLAGLLVDATLDQRYTGGDSLDDVAKKLGVDVKKTRVEVELAITWSDSKQGSKGTTAIGTTFTIIKNAHKGNFDIRFTGKGGSPSGPVRSSGSTDGTYKTLEKAKAAAVEFMKSKGGGK